jgi:glycosyltransferase involved in cell wall biosynthesis
MLDRSTGLHSRLSTRRYPVVGSLVTTGSPLPIMTPNDASPKTASECANTSAYNNKLLADAQKDAPFVLMIQPAWPRTGSAHVFHASAAGHRDRGSMVFTLLVPQLPSMADHENSAVVARDMEVPGTAGCATLRHINDPRGFCRRSPLHWLTARWRDHLLQRAEYIAAGVLPKELLRLIEKRPIDLIHVHHCWNMRLADRIARASAKQHGRRPYIIVETHDVQARNQDILLARHPLTGRPSPNAVLASAERALCSRADLLIHINQDDDSYFRALLPNHYHAVLQPTLATETERLLRGLDSDADGEALIYIGSTNYWNLQTVVWLLEDVLERIPDLAHRVRIHGKVADKVRCERPDLAERHGSTLVGPIETIDAAYRGACAVLVPALGGSGSSIKLLEALCYGRPIVATPYALRGVDPALAQRLPIENHANAADFAAAIHRIANGSPRGVPELTAAYAAHFSTTVHRQRFDRIMERMLPRCVEVTRGDDRSGQWACASAASEEVS